MTRYSAVSALVLGLLLAVPASAETLNEALSKAYTSSPDLQAARAALRSVDESASQARSGYRPQVTASGSVARSHLDTVGSEDSYTSRVASLTVQQPLFRGGRTAAAVREADSVIMAQRAQLLYTEQNILLSGVEAYLNVQRDMAVVDLNKNNEAVLRRQLKAVRDRFSVGEVTKTDVSQAEARLSGATSSRVQAEGALAASRASYQRIFGAAPSGLKDPDVKLELPASLDDLISEAQEHNPSVLSADKARLAADAVLDGAKAERLPTLTAEGTVSRSYDNGSSTYNKRDTGTVGLSMNWPLYTGGATSSRIREARQTITRREHEYDSANRSTVDLATRSWEQLDAAKATVVSRQSQVSAARIALDGVRQEASVGNRTVLDTLNAEQELLDAQVGLVRARHDETLAKFQVLAAAGRLTARELELPVEYYDEAAYYNRVRNQWIGSGD